MLDRCSWKQLPNGFSLLLIILLLVNYFVPFGDLDFAWQIRTAERIVKTGQLRPPEAFTYTISSSQETDFEWLYEIVLWGIWKTLGFGGLKLLKTILVVAPLLLMGLRLRAGGVRWYGVALALLTAVVTLSPGWNLRPLYCTTIGLLLVSGWLHDHCTGRQPLPWRLVPVMALWSNLHPGVIIGQGLLVGAIGCEWLNRWLRINPPLDRKASWRLAGIGCLGVLATFVSPHPLDRLLYPFRPELAHPIQQMIVEMQPLYVFLTRSPFTVGLVYALAFLVGLTLVIRFRQYRTWQILLLLGLTALANKAVRSLQDWVLIMLAFGVPHLAILLGLLGKQVRSWKRARAAHTQIAIPNAYVHVLVSWLSLGLFRVDRFCKRLLSGPLFCWQGSWLGLVGALLVVGSLIPPLARRMPIQESRNWPTEAVNFIEAHNLQGRFFTVPDFGSYLTWRLADRVQCYVCTRTFFYPPELLEDSHLVPQLVPDWQARLERIFAYGTDYFLLETVGARGKLWHLLKPHIERPLYVDDRTVLLSTLQVRGALQSWQAASSSMATAVPRQLQSETSLPLSAPVVGQ